MTIKQYVLDALGKFWTKLKSTYVTNCASTSNNLALAASQGKVLQDQITALNSRYLLTAEYYNVSAAKDCNTLTKELSLCQAASGLHFPSDSGFYYVFSYAYTKNSDGTISTGVQYAVQYATSQHIAWQRKCSNNTWDSWVKQPTRDEIDALNSKIAPGSWQTITNEYGTLSYKTNGIICELKYYNNTYTRNDSTSLKVFTLPSGARPSINYNSLPILGSSNGVYVYSNGDFYITNLTKQYAAFHIMYFIV